MNLPIVAYGDPILKKVAVDIDNNYKDLDELIANMYETMANANGVGLAAPQIGKSIRLFLVNATSFSTDSRLSEDERKLLSNFKKTFINPKIIKEEGEKWSFSEGCLSIPNVIADVSRNKFVTLEYYDENFQKHTENFYGLAARVIQHEYDHIEGVLFVDKISSLKKRLINKKLKKISKGEINVKYPMKFYLNPQ